MSPLDLIVPMLEILAVAGAAYAGLYRERPRLGVNWDIVGGRYAGVRFHNHGGRSAHRVVVTFLDPPGSVYFLEPPRRAPVFNLAPGEGKTIDLTSTFQLGNWLKKLDETGGSPKPCRIKVRYDYYRSKPFHRLRPKSRPQDFDQLRWNDYYQSLEDIPFEDRLLESLRPLDNLRSVKGLDNLLHNLQWSVCKHKLEPFNDSDELICRKCHRLVNITTSPYVEVGLQRDSQIELPEVIQFRLLKGSVPVPTPDGLAPSGRKDQAAEITVYENDTTLPLFLGKTGHRFYGTWGPEGNRSGSSKYQFEGIGEVVHRALDGGVRLFLVRVRVDGEDIVRSAF